MADSAATQTSLSNSPIEAAFRERTPGSAELADKARTLFPSGITHDARHLKPYGVYVERAAGPRKWDVDGNEYVDYFGGHGALLLGHAHPEVTRVTAEVMTHGTQFGSNHPWELRWAEAVMKLVPSVERIRFTSSGTEATHMALRLARDFTGKPKVLRFRTHFHGWHDHMTHGVASQFDGSAAPGVLASVAENALPIPTTSSACGPCWTRMTTSASRSSSRPAARPATPASIRRSCGRCATRPRSAESCWCSTRW